MVAEVVLELKGGVQISELHPARGQCQGVEAFDNAMKSELSEKVPFEIS